MLDALLGRPGGNRLSDGPAEGLDEPGVAGVADEVGPLVDGFGELVGESQENGFGHGGMIAGLLSDSASDSI